MFDSRIREDSLEGSGEARERMPRERHRPFEPHEPSQGQGPSDGWSARESWRSQEPQRLQDRQDREDARSHQDAQDLRPPRKNRRLQGSRKSRETKKPKKPYVGDYGDPLEGSKKVSVSVEMVALALVLGFVIGFLVFVALWLSSALTNLIWHNVMEGEAPWFMPIVLCTAGGLIIGLWTKYIGGDPEPLMKVMAQVKRTGSYKLKNIPASVVAFLLPLAFGGSVGLEAGLTGIIAAACSYIGRTLRVAGLRMKEVADLTVSASLSAIFGTPLAGIAMAAEDAMPASSAGDVDVAAEDAANAAGGPRDAAAFDGSFGAAAYESEAEADAFAASIAADAETHVASSASAASPTNTHRPDPDAYTFRRSAKILLYSAAAFGSIGGLMLLNELTGGLTGIPHFGEVQAAGAEFFWAIPCLAIAYAMALIHHASERATHRLADAMGRFTVLKPLIVGAIIGSIAVILPNVLFCGEEQGFEIQQNWQAVGVAVLLGTGLVKVAATSLCLNMGWHGGNFFPNIYAGISAGYGMALLTGADPMLCVTVVTSAYLGGVFRRPLIVLALLILCFPLRSIVWMGLACVIGSVLPLPAALQPKPGEE